MFTKILSNKLTISLLKWLIILFLFNLFAVDPIVKGLSKSVSDLQDKAIVKKAVGMHEKQLHAGKKSDMSKLKSGGMACAPKKMAKGGGIEMKGKTKGTMIKMKKGGSC